MVSLTLAFALLCGLILGSFANVLIHRLPRGESIVNPPSHCPHCGSPIRWFQNIPVASWVFLRGRCAACGGPIAVRYPAVEASVGALFLLSAWVWGPTFAGAAAGLFALLCVVLGLIDLEHQILPDRLTLPGIALGLLFSPYLPWTNLTDSLAGAALGAAIPALLIALYALFGIEAMGWGDVKFLAMVGAFLGWRGALLTILGGALLGTLLGGGYLLLTGKGRRTPLPFGTFLSAAALASLFFAGRFWAWYGALLGRLSP
ncbi:MAG: prepilin peptidase [Acidobacteriota bacterium]